MNEDRLKRLLDSAPVPEEEQVEERSWRLLETAFEDHRAASPGHPRARRGLIALAGAGAALALVLTPAGAKVSDLIARVVSPAEKNTSSSLRKLPTGGRLLVESAKGPWIVQSDGSRRRLGAYGQASWSPHGLYVAAARGNELAAVDPLGAVHWAVSSAGWVSDPRWSTSGVRVAYLSGASLRVTAGDGTADRLIDPAVAKVAPAWRPLRHPLVPGQTLATGPGTNVLAYVSADGTVRAINTDSGRTLWTYRPPQTPIELAWLPHGDGLAILTSASLVELNGSGAPLAPARSFSPDSRGAIAASPTDRRIAEIRRLRSGRSVLLLLHPKGASQRLFSGPGSFRDLAWSPDGRWLVLGWPGADQLVFVQPGHPRSAQAIANITRQFDPGGSGPDRFPRLNGWCCAP